MTAAGRVVADRLMGWLRDRRVGSFAAARSEVSPDLQRWMGMPDDMSLTQLEVQAWVCYRDLGVTDEIAQSWSERGYGPGIAAAALVDGVSLDRVAEVDDLAWIFREAGAWDGLDRLALTDLIGWHLEVEGDVAYPYPVLGRWLALPPALILQRVRQAVHIAVDSRVRAGRVCQFTADPVNAAAASVLEELENQT